MEIAREKEVQTNHFAELLEQADGGLADTALEASASASVLVEKHFFLSTRMP